MTTGREGRATIGDSVLFYGGDAAVVPQGELGDPLRRIEAIHLKQLSSRHQVKILHVKKIYVSLCAHTYLQMDQRQKQHTKNRTKHRTPSEKEKKERQKCSNVYTFFTSTLKEITALMVV